MSSKKVKLLDDPAAPPSKLVINQSFAESFDRRKRREEIRKAKEKARELGIDLERDEEEDSSTSEDEDAELLNEKVDAKFLKMMALIRSKDPRLKDENFKMFSDSDFEEDEQTEKKKKKDKPVLYKDLHIETLLKEGPEADEADEEDKVEVPVQEQKRLRSEFLQAVNEWEKGEAEEGLLKPRKKPKFVSEDITLPLLQADGEPEQETVKQYWTSMETEEDAFLKKFILKKEWKEEEPELMTYDEVVDTEDKKRDQEMELFELAYNYRFEEEGFERIKTYARQVNDSVRVKSDTRKQQREVKKARKELEKKHKEEAIKHFKNLKKQEILDRMNIINTLAGTNTHLSEEMLDEEFDPKAHDKLMAKIFNEEYYQKKEHKSDLQLPDEVVPKNDESTNDIDLRRIEEEVDLPQALREGEGDWWLCNHCNEPIPAGTLRYDCLECDNFTLCEACRDLAEHPHRLKKARVPKVCIPPSQYVAVCCNECGKNVTCERRFDCVTCSDYTVCEGCRDAKVHPHPLRCLEDELWKEYLEMDFEVDGPKFRYRDVPAEDYGLEEEDILDLDDKTLNSLISLKKLAPYREDDKKINKANIRKRVKWIKKQKKRTKEVTAAPTSDPAEERLKSYGLGE